MHIVITYIVFCAIIYLITAETSESPNKLQLKTPKTEVSAIDSEDESVQMPSLWAYRPISEQQQENEYFKVHPVFLREPYALTKLAKSFALGYDPYFNKGYFAPFEKRPKPVTLVAFRRNGFLPRKTMKVADSKSSEVAELQSPFNEISRFWEDKPGM